VVGLCMGVALVLASAGCGDQKGVGRVTVGSRVPGFSLTTATNEKVTDRSLEGRVVLLNFWSTSCVSCIKEMPDLQQLEESNKATVVGIALEGADWQPVKSFLKRHPVTYRVALGDEDLFERFGGVAIPYSLLLDRSMRVVKVYRGPVTQDVLANDIQALEAGREREAPGG
jgi:thiol-disulfide isomerase/thioredoxin